MLPVAMVTIRPYYLHRLKMKDGSLSMPKIPLKKYKFINFHLHLHLTLDKA